MSRVVLITGACGGIGRVLCRRFALEGDFVLAQDCDSDGLIALVAELGGKRCRAVVADLRDAEVLNLAVSAAIHECGPIAVLVANAGAAEGLSLKNTTIEMWQRDIHLNLNGTFHSVEAVRPSMMAQHAGSLVLIGSVNGMQALGHPAYSAAKAGLISYTKALAMEFGPFGIRANIVCPGTVKTPAWQARVDKNPQVLENLKKWYPLGDFATPDDVADAVLFLASSHARMITGVALPVDGGLSAGNRVLAHELTLEEF
jgi:NAD(P)-dependent dehydrogenase (short-subunit alcohol dehydrogenase family)